VKAIKTKEEEEAEEAKIGREFPARIKGQLSWTLLRYILITSFFFNLLIGLYSH